METKRIWKSLFGFFGQLQIHWMLMAVAGVLTLIIQAGSVTAGSWTQLGGEFYSGNAMNGYRMSLSGSTPTLAYVEGNTGTVRTLYVKHWDGSQWATDSAVPVTASLKTTSVKVLALDGLVPYIAWTQQPYPDQQASYCIAKYENGQWTVIKKTYLAMWAVPSYAVLRVYQGSVYLTGYSLSPDSRMWPHSVFFDRWNGTNWVNGATFTTGNLTAVYNDRSLVVSETGDTYFSYALNGTLMIYHRLPSGNWEALPSIRPGGQGCNPALYIQNGVLYLAWYESGYLTSGWEIRKYTEGTWQTICTQVPIHNSCLAFALSTPVGVINRSLQYYRNSLWETAASLVVNSGWNMDLGEGFLETYGNTLCVTWKETLSATGNRYYAGTYILAASTEPTLTPTQTCTVTPTPTPLVTPGITATPSAPPAYMSNQSADIVVGQPDFTSGGSGLGPTRMYYPNGIFSDGSRMFVADTTHHRVLIYNHLPSSNNAPADVVLGQADMWGGTSNYGGISARSLGSPQAVFCEDGKMFVADTGNHRVLIFNQLPTSNYAAADVVLGQPDMTSNSENYGGISACSFRWPNSVYSDGQKFYVSDSGNNRILIYNQIPTANFTPADIVVGQIDMISVGPAQVDAYSVTNPYCVQSDGKRLFITDNYNSRVLIYNQIPVANHAAADVVVGEPDMFTRNNYGSNPVSAYSLSSPSSAYSDGRSLYIADGYCRVLIYHAIPTVNQASADVVLGQPDMTHNGQPGFRGANTLFSPGSVLPVGSTLFVADTGNNRVLLYRALTTSVTPTYTQTPTPSPTFTPTPTQTFTVTPTETPDANDTWVEHFSGVTGGHVFQWADETTHSGYNATIKYAATSSRARIQRTSAGTWGKVLSPWVPANPQLYPLVQINVTALSGGTWKLGIQELEGEFRYWALNDSCSQTGVFTFDYGAFTDWNAGDHHFAFQLILEGGDSAYLEVDWIKATRKSLLLTSTPTATCTPNLTATLTPVVLWTEDFSYSDDVPPSVPGAQCPGWYDETNNPSFNAEIDYASTNGLAQVSTVGADWGKVLSFSQDIDVSFYRTLDVQVDSVTGGTVKIAIFSQTNGWEEHVSNVSISTPGQYYFDIPAMTGWSGVKNMGVELIVEGAQCTTSINRIRIHAWGIPSSTPTPTATVTATATPPPSVQWNESFAYSDDAPPSSPGIQCPGWYDESNDAAFNAEIAYASTDGLATLSTTGAVWGKVLSFSQDVDVSTYRTLEVTIQSIPNGRVKVAVFSQASGWEEHLCSGSIGNPGTYYFDIPASTGWSGVKNMGVELIIEGATGTAVFDSVRIHAQGIPTPTPTRTSTPTFNGLWQDVFEYTDDTPPSAPGNQPPGWYDETDDGGFNAEFRYSATNGLAELVKVGGEIWGKTLSFRQNVDLAQYPILEVTFNSIDGGSVSMGVFRNDPSWTEITLGYAVQPGVYRYDLRSIGWTGTINMGVFLRVDQYYHLSKIDSVRILSAADVAASSVSYFCPGTKTSTQVPTQTQTPTRTATPTATPIPTSSVTATCTQGVKMDAGQVLAFPNPARGKVTFAYAVPGVAKVTIDIYRLTGERVASIEERKDGSAQTFTTAWQAAGVAPGVYFCRIVATDVSGKEVLNVKKKVALVK